MSSANDRTGFFTREDRQLRKAAFAGGCFWCMEHPFDQIPGVVSVTPGYTGGHKKDPTYDEVSSGETGHAEAVLVIYDPNQVSYEKLLDVYWRNIDPATRNRQFCDIGHQYRTAIFYFDEQQRRLAEDSREQLEKTGEFKGPIVTEIVPAGDFYPAEDYHQQYYRKNPTLYESYRAQCGRDQRLEELWGKKGEKTSKK
ncbi:MAG: peptide-methionine (S)-S-oxide reductase MsrA [Nitrospiraceae bacterium]|nr:peptide-methionine (S)-S-oxide reductase MsrA [Nitrospiraceae bacterium]